MKQTFSRQDVEPRLEDGAEKRGSGPANARLVMSTGIYDGEVLVIDSRIADVVPLAHSEASCEEGYAA